MERSEDVVSPSFKFHLFKEVYKDSDNPRYDLKEDDQFFNKEISELSTEEVLYYESYIFALNDKLNDVIKIKIKIEQEKRKRQKLQEEDEFKKREHERKRQERQEEHERKLQELQELEEFQIREHERKLQELQELEEFQIREHERKRKERQEEHERKLQEFIDEEETREHERELQELIDEEEFQTRDNEVYYKHQIDAQKDKRNFIYAYPEQVDTQFPVYCCHHVFCDFMDIINDNKSSQAFRAYSKFIDENMETINFDGCVDKLISAMLSVNSESVFVKEFINALEIVFPIFSQAAMPVSARDTGIFINNFPFILVKAKHMAYSIDAVLQGLQYYGLSRHEMIDNNPCFLLTLDHGILFVYGVATVSRRVVCDFLASFEFTNYHFNLNNFLTRLFRCISGLYYFYKTFSDRIKNKSSDAQHQKYNLAKNRKSPDNQPFPAIFDVKAWNSNDGNNIMSDNERIPITFKEVQFLNNMTKSKEFRANLSKNIFLVKTDREEIAVLKICSNYSIRAHALLAEDGLAPKIIGYEKLSENCHVILMEYLKNYMSILEFCSQKNNEIRSKIIELLKDLLKKIQAKGVVHGDFRFPNIFMKIVDNGDTNNAGVLAVTNDIVVADNNNLNVADDDSKNMDFDILNSTIEFKIIDFEFSGMNGEMYPCLALKNKIIPWHQGFKSFLPRQFAHDEHMLEKMIGEFNCMPATYNVIFTNE